MTSKIPSMQMLRWTPAMLAFAAASAARWSTRANSGFTRRAVVLAVTMSVVPVLGAASRADATVTTKYYTINVSAPTPSSSGLFLAPRDGYRVTLNRYLSGDVSAQWTPVWAGWPANAPVTGHGPEILSEVAGCLRHFYEGCPFQGHGELLPPVKLVNRASGKCLTIGHPWRGDGTPVHQVHCVPNTGPGLSDQVWELNLPSLPNNRLETQFVQVKRHVARCLSVSGGQNVLTAPLKAWTCRGWHPFYQRFRTLLAAQVTCQPSLVSGGICGLLHDPFGPNRASGP